jgi:hypothetical protein
VCSSDLTDTKNEQRVRLSVLCKDRNPLNFG